MKMKRAALERPRTVREWQRHVAAVHDGDIGQCVCNQQPGRFRKTDAFDCGVTRCRVCHYDKFLGRRYKTFAEIKSDITYREQLIDLDLSSKSK